MSGEKLNELLQLRSDILDVANRDTLLSGVREDWNALTQGLYALGYRRVSQ